MIYALLAVIVMQAAAIGWLFTCRRALTKQLARERSATGVWIKLYDDAMSGWKRSFMEKLNLSKSLREDNGADVSALRKIAQEQSAVINAQPRRQ